MSLGTMYLIFLFVIITFRLCLHLLRLPHVSKCYSTQVEPVKQNIMKTFSAQEFQISSRLPNVPGTESVRMISLQTLVEKCGAIIARSAPRKEVFHRSLGLPAVSIPRAKQKLHSCIEVAQLLLSSVERPACCTKSSAVDRKNIASHMSNQAWRSLKASKPGMNQDLNEIQCLEFEHDSKHDLSWRCVAFAAGDVANRTTKLQRKLCKLRADVHAISPVGLSLKSKNTKRHAKT